MEEVIEWPHARSDSLSLITISWSAVVLGSCYTCRSTTVERYYIFQSEHLFLMTIKSEGDMLRREQVQVVGVSVDS